MLWWPAQTPRRDPRRSAVERLCLCRCRPRAPSSQPCIRRPAGLRGSACAPSLPAPDRPEQQSARLTGDACIPATVQAPEATDSSRDDHGGGPRLPLRSRFGDARSARSSSANAPARASPADCRRAGDPTTGRDFGVVRVPVQHPPAECRRTVNPEVGEAAVVRLPGHHPAPHQIDPETISGRVAAGRTRQPT